MKCETIVVGYDGSSNARRALETAVDHLEPGGTIHVVTAFRPTMPVRLPATIIGMRNEYSYIYGPYPAEGRHLDDAEQWLRSQHVQCVTHLVPDNPAEAIITVAEREAAGLIVVGSHGLGYVRRVVRGSVSSRVATHAATSVLIVYEPEPAGGSVTACNYGRRT